MRLSREDWLDHGLRIVWEHGPEELKIDRLCARMSVTKGSFYHHFADRQAFVAALLARWEAVNTERLIDAVASTSDVRERSVRLSDEVRRADQRPEVALRAWARQDPVVAEHVRSVDARRIAYLAALVGERTGDAPGARLVAKLLYAHLVGVQQLGPLVSRREWREMDELLDALLDARGRSGRRKWARRREPRGRGPPRREAEP